MFRQSFNRGWTAGPAETSFASAVGGEDDSKVTLPHDSVRNLARSATDSEGAHTGYFPGGYFQYSKIFDVPEAFRDKSVFIEFEGVYRDAVVYINEEFVAQRPNGYSRFHIKCDPYLRYGQPNSIRVETRAHLDSRWYSGAGIHRDTHLIVGDPVHIAVDGVRVTTPQVDDELAVVVVAVTVVNEERSTRTMRVSTTVAGSDGITVAEGTTPLTLLPGTSASARLRLHVPRPALWDVDSPNLYVARTTLSDCDSDEAVNEAVDEEHTTFGIRDLQLDPARGLRINGRTVKLRGACIHHDTGLLGAAAISRAEQRRIEILKAAGFNAVRSAHNPLSVAALDACDRLGMLVLDEAFDVWTKPKRPFDYSLAFPEWWERDVESMVTKDFNHPSVIMYSIGNEIFEVGSPVGSTWGRRLAEKVRELDDTRFVTNAVNGLVAVPDELPSLVVGSTEGPTDINSLITALGEKINEFSASQLVSERTEESHAVLDVSGINYGDARYVPDALAFPNRLVLGTETFPGHIDELWRLVTENSHVLGDFTWTGWDYLGESGVGRTDYLDDGPKEDMLGGIHDVFPALTAGCADIDITGHRRPMSYYRETVFGLREQPYIAVHRPQFHGRAMFQTPWSWADAVSSWSWDVEAGSPVTIDVYSSADEVELLLDGVPLERIQVGGHKACIARFESAYRPGELTAVAYRAGVETGRCVLRSAGADLRLTVAADRPEIRADDKDLAYVAVELRDGEGNPAGHRDRQVHVDVTGPGVLAGLGTGRTHTEERFDADSCTTFDGRAMAVVRPTGPGDIHVRVRAEGCPETTAVVHAVEA
ncbi:glycoside hydrolase family 2 TIM barrel-domain containing protein [Streptomyces sp. NPDC020766]|uniref:glycoside hydrolase family 2 TIM barrel-domain containing protein n=1 Tax=Streptomyces sp. NPDC020766 TaxID=3155011 RepID=UPI0033EA0DC6